MPALLSFSFPKWFLLSVFADCGRGRGKGRGGGSDAGSGEEPAAAAACGGRQWRRRPRPSGNQRRRQGVGPTDVSARAKRVSTHVMGPTRLSQSIEHGSEAPFVCSFFRAKWSRVTNRHVPESWLCLLLCLSTSRCCLGERIVYNLSLRSGI